MSTLDTVDAVAARRRIDARQLGLLLRGDLDWIVMKAIDKDRTRRYETANALSEDIRRHLGNEPVTASPPSTLYRLRKFVRRNKGPVAAASLVAAALVAGIIATAWALVWALEERARATLAEEEAIRRAGELEKVAAFQAAQLDGIEPASMGLELREGILRQARSGWGRAGLGADEVETRLEELGDHLARANLTTVALEVLDRLGGT